MIVVGFILIFQYIKLLFEIGETVCSNVSFDISLPRLRLQSAVSENPNDILQVAGAGCTAQ